MATDRHAPHAHHGKDMVIIQASHVGYDPDSGKFGVYRRLQTENTVKRLIVEDFVAHWNGINVNMISLATISSLSRKW